MVAYLLQFYKNKKGTYNRFHHICNNQIYKMMKLYNLYGERCKKTKQKNKQ